MHICVCCIQFACMCICVLAMCIFIILYLYIKLIDTVIHIHDNQVLSLTAVLADGTIIKVGSISV